MLPIHSFVGDSGLPLRGADSVSKPNLVSTVALIDVVNSVEGLVNLAYLIEQNRHKSRRRFAIHPNGKYHFKAHDEPHHSNSNVGDGGNHYAVRQV
jgi:hypothetical protein